MRDLAISSQIQEQRLSSRSPDCSINTHGICDSMAISVMNSAELAMQFQRSHLVAWARA